MIELLNTQEISIVLKWCIVLTAMLIALPIISLLKDEYLNVINRKKKMKAINDFTANLNADEINSLINYKFKSKHINECILIWNEYFNKTDEINQVDLQTIGSNKKILKWLSSNLKTKKITNKNALTICNAIHLVGNLSLYGYLEHEYKDMLLILAKSKFPNISVEAIVCLLKISSKTYSQLAINILIANNDISSNEIQIINQYLDIEQTRKVIGSTLSNINQSKRQNRIIDLICNLNDSDYYMDYVTAEKDRFSNKSISKLIHCSAGEKLNIKELDNGSYEIKLSILNKIKKQSVMSLEDEKFINECSLDKNEILRNTSRAIKEMAGIN